MPLTRKTILALSVWLVVTVLSLVALTSLVINKGFAEVELMQARRNVLRTHNAVEQAYEDLTTKLNDWAFWDDTYAFVSDANRNYQSSNLNDDSQDTALNDLIVLHSHTGKRLWGRIRVDGKWQDISDEGWGEAVEFSSKVPALPEATYSMPQVMRDIIRVGDEAFLVTAAPVLTSNRSGPSQGVLMFGRSVQAYMPKAIAQTVALPTESVDVSELEQHRARAKSGAMTPIPDAAMESWFERTDDQNGLLYVVLRDRKQDPVLTVRVTIPRETTHIGTKAVRLFFTLLIVSAVILTALAIFGIYHLFLRRISGLSRDVDRISASGDTAARVQAKGSDEISLLASRINQMLSTLQTQEQKLAEWAMQLDSARSTAIESSRAKSAFLANMSHEIRTPMTAILGFADLVLEPEGRPSELAVQQESVATIKRNAEHLLTIINDILDISKIEAGKMTVESIECSPLTLIEEVRDLMSVRAASKKISLTVDIDGPMPRCLVSDPVRIRQILFNLLGNAIKFTPPPPESPGRISVRVACENAGSPEARLCISVIDTGVGVSDEMLPRLFEQFVQEDATFTRRFGGTGLGLTISRRLARMLGGELECVQHRKEELGTTFRFWLPIAHDALMIEGPDVPATPPASITASTLGQPLTGRILLAEDGVDNQRLISHVLGKAGAQVTIAGDGAKGYDAACAAADSDAGPFDLILLDMQMPEMDGYEVASHLRARGYLGPIVALTAHAMAGDRDRCLAAGCNDYLTKPIDRTSLIAACRHWIETGISLAAGQASPTNI